MRSTGGGGHSQATEWTEIFLADDSIARELSEDGAIAYQSGGALIDNMFEEGSQELREEFKMRSVETRNTRTSFPRSGLMVVALFLVQGRQMELDWIRNR